MSSPAFKPAMNSLSVGPIKSENAVVNGWAQCLLQVESTLCHLFTNKEENSKFPSLHTYQRQLVFLLKPLQAAPA